ncbi:hypothetical protein ACFWJW_25110 [Streptomyces sp. NPDC127097]|uniref:hypothetical protein n=1 Tax=Streptomyces sp. NPDC127097 TaxID=3347136 RepID=UPI0036588A2D
MENPIFVALDAALAAVAEQTSAVAAMAPVVARIHLDFIWNLPYFLDDLDGYMPRRQDLSIANG